MFLTFKNSPNHKQSSQTHIETHFMTKEPIKTSKKANEPIKTTQESNEPNKNMIRCKWTD